MTVDERIADVKRRLETELGFNAAQSRREGHWAVLRVFPGVMDVPATEYGDWYWRELQKIESDLAKVGLIRVKHKCMWGEFLVIARGDPSLYISDGKG